VVSERWTKAAAGGLQECELEKPRGGGSEQEGSKRKKARKEDLLGDVHVTLKPADFSVDSSPYP
jgi:hypothetical protein